MAIKLNIVVLKPEKSRCYPVQSATECLPQESCRNMPWFARLVFNFAIFSGPAPRLFWSLPVRIYMFESFERALRWQEKNVLRCLLMFAGSVTVLSRLIQALLCFSYYTQPVKKYSGQTDPWILH